MGRKHKNIYVFISDENTKYYRAAQLPNSSYSVTKNSQPYPLQYTPTNIVESEFEFATNNKYFSLNRAVGLAINFIKDGAAILRELYYLGKGAEEKTFVTVIVWNGVTNLYELAFRGKVDYSQKQETPKSGEFTVPLVDDTVWGVLSNNDDVVYSIDCSERNPDAIKVLIDRVTLLDRITYQTVKTNIFSGGTVSMGYENDTIIPLLIVNEDGDTSGILKKNQTYQNLSNFVSPTVPLSENYAILSQYPVNNVNFTGTFVFTWDNFDNANAPLPSGTIALFIVTSLQQRFTIFANGFTPLTGVQPYNLVRDQTYTTNFNITMNLQAGEKVFFATRMFFTGFFNQHFRILPEVQNIVVSLKTAIQPQIVYGIRPLDVLQSLVKQATNGRYSINSSYFTVNNKSVVTCGDAIRGTKNARIYSSFADFFKTFDSLNYMALRNIGDDLFIEKATTVYDPNSTIINIGEIIDLKLACASEFFFNEVQVGSPKQDYRHPSGRLEFNSENSFSLDVLNTSKKLDLVTKYRTGYLDIVFLLLDYRGGSTQDNNGDKSVFLLDITDNQITSAQEVSTFENITIDSAPLQPYIHYPFQDDVITNNRPTLSGAAPAGFTVNVYVDNVLDGGTVANAQNRWTYNIITPLSTYVLGGDSGIHTIDVTYTDNIAPVSSVSITIDTALTTGDVVVYPKDNDSLYNNNPLINGLATPLSNVIVYLDNVAVGTVVADRSGRWFYQAPVLTNGVHIISINTSQVKIFSVNSFVSSPLITYIDGELDGNVIINNLPLIKGVALPNTIISLWLNYISYSTLNASQVIANANGNWEFQVVPINYSDPLSGNQVVLAPIQNGLNVISTFLINRLVKVIVTGFELNRPPFSQILGVTDNTVFNTAYSPKRMLLNRNPLTAAVLAKQPQARVRFQTSDKNGLLSTTLNGVQVKENANIKASELGAPIAILEYAEIKTRTYTTFAKALRNFNNGGVIKATYRGTDIFMLPIGNMKMDSLIADTQEWKLLLAPTNTYQSLLNLYKNGLTIKLMTKSFYHSDYNSLHFVAYDFQKSPKYQNLEIDQDWFENRNSAWLLNPYYTQKFQRVDVIKDQVITNGVNALNLLMYRCEDASLVSTFQYQPVTPSPIMPPDVVMEVEIDFSLFPEDKYFFVFSSTTQGGVVKLSAISEIVETRDEWRNTILIESGNTENKPDFFFSSGIKSIVRVEGIVKKLQPNITSIGSRQEDGNTDMLYSQITKQRIVRFGTAYGLPDYLYLKIAAACVLNGLMIEGVEYSLQDDNKIEPSEDVSGHPLYYYQGLFSLRTNKTGGTFEAEVGADTGGIVLVVDAEAFGMPAGSILNIDVTP